MSLQNIQCHLDAVARGGVVARVSDHQTVEADRWRRKCKSVSRFEEAQAGAAQRTSGRSRKSTKPEMQRGKVAVSMCTQIQVSCYATVVCVHVWIERMHASCHRGCPYHRWWLQCVWCRRQLHSSTGSWLGHHTLRALGCTQRKCFQQSRSF